jgi:hypothetical protein
MIVHDRVVLGVDQAINSGWSIRVGVRPVQSGELDVWNWEARRYVLRLAFDFANHDARTQGPRHSSRWIPKWFVFVYEDHAQAPLSSYKSTPQVLSLGGSRNLWLDSLNRMGHPQELRINVASRVWRTKVLGLKAALRGEECKAQAVRWAEDHTGKRPLHHDEAEALCVSQWGATEGFAELERVKWVGAYRDSSSP